MSGFLIPDGRDLDQLFTAGNGGQTTNLIANDGVDLGQRFLAGNTGIVTGIQVPDGRDVGSIFSNMPTMPIGSGVEYMRVAERRWCHQDYHRDYNSLRFGIQTDGNPSNPASFQWRNILADRGTYHSPVETGGASARYDFGGFDINAHYVVPDNATFRVKLWIDALGVLWDETYTGLFDTGWIRSGHMGSELPGHYPYEPWDAWPDLWDQPGDPGIQGKFRVVRWSWAIGVWWSAIKMDNFLNGQFNIKGSIFRIS